MNPPPPSPFLYRALFLALLMVWIPGCDQRESISLRTQDDAAAHPHPLDDSEQIDESGLAQPAGSSKLPIYELRMSIRDLMAMEHNAYSDERFPGTFTFQNEIFENIQVRHRGAWARSWPKKPIKIFFSSEQLFQGRRRLNLNSAWRDPAFVREHLSYEIYKACRVPAPQSRMVRLHLNGKFHGLYVEVEQPDKAFLTRINLPGASIYKANSRANQSDERKFRDERSYQQHYEKETQKDESYQDLQLFCEGLDARNNVHEFFTRNVDLEKYINYLAASVLVQNWDAFNKNHFLVYDGRGSKKWFVVPWDLDRTLGDHWNGSFDEARLPIFLGTRQSPGVTGWNRMADAFFSDPKLKARFLDRLAELLEQEFTEQKLFPILDQLEEDIRPEATMDLRRWPSPRGSLRNGIAGVKRFIQNRRAFLQNEFAKLRR